MNMIYHGPDTVYQFKHMQNRWAEKSNILLNKIQYVSMFLAVLNSLLYSKNTIVYIIASNKKFLSIDIITELRGDQITFKSIFLRTIKDVVNWEYNLNLNIVYVRKRRV